MRMAEQIDQIVTKLERSKNWIVTQAIAACIDQESLRDQMRYEVQVITFISCKFGARESKGKALNMQC